MNAEAMRKILADEYGIHTDAELDAAIERIGTIPISLFVDNREENRNAVRRETAGRVRSVGGIGYNLADDRFWNRNGASSRV